MKNVPNVNQTDGCASTTFSVFLLKQFVSVGAAVNIVACERSGTPRAATIEYLLPLITVMRAQRTYP